jgi:branched-chain amino acid transport system substrate-binding protein
MGGDGIVDSTYVSLGGRPGDLATSVGAPAETLPSAKQFLDDYAAKNYAEEYSTYGALTYDATNVIIEGVAKALAGGDYTPEKRADIVKAVQDTNLQGASGEVSFDEFGDTTNKVLTVYEVEGDSFAPVEGSTGAFEG